MLNNIKTIEQLLSEIDIFIKEIEHHTGYKSIIYIIENPFVQMLSQITGFQPGYFGVPINNGDYVKFDIEKIKEVRDMIFNSYHNRCY